MSVYGEKIRYINLKKQKRNAGEGKNGTREEGDKENDLGVVNERSIE